MALLSGHARMRRLGPAARVLLACVCLSVAACGASGPKRPPVGAQEPDKFLFENGSKALKEKRWFVAREYFRQLIDTYPQSQYRADAKLGVGDTYLGEGSAEGAVLALNEFREFLNFYPTHDRADYAQFQLGMTHFKDMRAPERDQTETREAVTEFTTFLTRYPNSSLAPEARLRLREARDRLSMSEYRVGVFYFRQQWFPGAIDRFQALLKSDPEFTHRDGIYYYLAQIFIKAGRPAEALPYLDRLVKEFEKSEYLADAQKQIEQIKNGTIKEGK